MGEKPVLKTKEEIELMRLAGKVVAVCLRKLQEAAQPGVCGEELDELAEATIIGLGARPAFKGYGGYPANFCLSINDEVVHGIPTTRRLEQGDIVGIDIGAVLNGFYADAATSFGIGEISPDAKKLLSVTKASLFVGIDQARHNKRIGDISRAVQTHAEKAGYSVVRDLVGHGIGREMHEPPQVPNVVLGKHSLQLKVGMTLAIEPMINAGDWRIKKDADGWTYRTSDGSLSAHFEHTVAITEKGPVILTLEDDLETK